MEIIFEDQNIIVIIKEVGIESEHQMCDLLQVHTHTQIYPVHRLDKNVGGVMVYAKNKKTAALFSKMIQQKLLVKEYVTLISGHLEKKEGILEDFLFKDRYKNKVFVVKRQRKGVKKAKLEYDVIKEDEEHSLVHVLLHTGRTHQIRVQFASRKHPLVGDHKYGSKSEVKEPMLYSCRISFPYQNKQRSFESYPTWAK